MLFAFGNKDYRIEILSSTWFIGSRGLFLEQWQLVFDPTKEQIMLAPIWITLPNIPFDIWNYKVFEGIGNSFGRFIKIDDVTKAQTKMISARFYVMVDFGVKLLTSITLEAEERNFEQEIKYEQNNCLCSLYNQVGHIMRACPKRMLRDKKEWRSKPPQEEPHVEKEEEGDDPEGGEINQNIKDNDEP